MAATLPVNRANNIHLIILPGFVASVHIDNVVCVVNAKNRIGCVPVDVVALFNSLEAMDDAATEKEY